jgi:hypothetical protein
MKKKYNLIYIINYIVYFLKITKINTRTGVVAQMIEYLPSEHKALSSKPYIVKTIHSKDEY